MKNFNAIQRLVGFFSIVYLVISLVTQSYATCPQPSFRSASLEAAGNDPNDIVSADFNRDGKLDLATANGVGDNISVLLGDGVGGFSDPTHIAAGDAPQSMETADVNRDGRLDLVVVNFGTDNVSVFIGNGNGGFAAAANFATGDNPIALAVGDYNNNGSLDVAVLRLNRNAISVHLGAGNGTFGAATNASMAPGLGTREIFARDFNRDGNLDLVASGLEDVGGIAILIGNGAGGFSVGPFVPTSTSTTEFFNVGDVNMDGRWDLITANRFAGNVSVILGNGNGTFGAANNIPIVGSPISVGIGDFNLDGRPDVAIGKNVESAATIMQGDGAGNFTVGPSILGGTGFHLAIGDFNGDGKPDFATGNGPTDDIGIRLNNCGGLTTKPTPDFTGDGARDIAFFRPSNGFWFVLRSENFTFFAFPFGTNGDVPVPGDYDGDGITDAAVFRPGIATWFVNPSAGGSIAVQFGVSTDTPMPGDYDGDGRNDFAIYRPSSGEWWMLRSNTNTVLATQFGGAGDIPIE